MSENFPSPSACYDSAGRSDLLHIPVLRADAQTMSMLLRNISVGWYLPPVAWDEKDARLALLKKLIVILIIDVHNKLQ